MPVQTLIDYLEGGDSLEAFLTDFPSVSREHAIAVLETIEELLEAHPRLTREGIQAALNYAADVLRSDVLHPTETLER